MTKARIRAADVVRDVRSGMSEVDLQRKYDLTPAGIQYVLRRSVETGLMTSMELYERTPLSESEVMRAFDTSSDGALRCRLCGRRLPDGNDDCPSCQDITASLGACRRTLYIFARGRYRACS